MYGLSAIEAANGWSMAVLGGSIVFCGLVALSIAISQLHKVLNLWDRWGPLSRDKGAKKTNQVTPKKTTQNAKNVKDEKGTEEVVCSHPSVCPADVDEIVIIWEPLVNQLDSPFYLSDLHELARKYNFPHPYLTINRLRNANILVPCGEGLFEWNANSIEEGIS